MANDGRRGAGEKCRGRCRRPADAAVWGMVWSATLRGSTFHDGAVSVVVGCAEVDEEEGFSSQVDAARRISVGERAALSRWFLFSLDTMFDGGDP